MPTKRRAKSARKRERKLVLLFEARPISRSRWDRHREQIMGEEARDGRRPPEWWLYEKGLPQPDRDREAATLLEMGELGKSELAGLMKEWRERWEQAQVPNFAHCIGSKPGEVYARWLEGTAARKAHYRWAGIPVALVKQWGAERRQSARVVQGLISPPPPR